MVRKKNVKADETPQKNYVLITLDEKRARENKMNNRLNDFRAVLNFLDEALRELEKQEDARRIQEDWLEYLACEGLPKPNSPPEIRLFFLHKRYVEAEIVKDTLDWQLNVDERSILSQDIFRKDMTRVALNKVLRPEFGVEYNQCIDDALKILRRLQQFLGDEKLMSQEPDRILKDIKEQPLYVQQEILEFFNRYTYRILCSEASYMEHVDDIAAEYRFTGNNFAIHIWALKHVPINFNPYDFPSILADLSEIQAQLQIPFSVLRDDISIRSIHFKFDHFSEHTKSFNQRPNLPASSINVMIPDISKCLTHEWEMQMELENEVRNHMIALRAEYEEKMQLIEEEANKKQKGKKKPQEDKKEAKQKAPKKPPKEQPLITDNTYPDIWEDFLIKEQNLFDNFIDAVYHPNVLNLNQFEVNMKEYIILGGVYQIVFVQKPDHTSFSSFTMTWHAHNGNLYIDKDVKADLQVDYAKFHRTKTQRFTTGTTARYSEAEAKRRTTLLILESIQKSLYGDHAEQDVNQATDRYLKDVEVSPYFVITLDLPAHLCLWGEPQPCHFEADITSIVETAYPEAETRENIRYARATLVEQEIYNFANQIPNLPGQSASTTTLVGGEQNPNVETGLQKISSYLQPTEDKKPSLGLKIDGVELKDFNIHLPMTKGQIRTMQRHCIPRIISSLKFPMEQAEEETEESRTKPKGLGGTLVRKRQSEGEDRETIYKQSEHNFSYRLQNNPERFYPIFSQVENIKMPFPPEDYAAMLRQFEPQTFFELLHILDNLKKIYQERYKVLFDLPVVLMKPRKKRHQPVGPQPIEAPPVNETKAQEEKASKKSPKKGGKGGGDKANTEKAPKEGHRGTRFLETNEFFDDYDYEDNISSENEDITYAHWTKKHIFHTVFNRENRKLMIWTDRVGTIGLAFKRYEHFPFQYWSLEPREDDPEKGVVFRIHTQFAKLIIFVSTKGYSGYVTSLVEVKKMRDQEKYFEIKEPIRDLRDLKRVLSENNFNIFSQEDARYYIENGYFCEKHLATEIHCYTCMAIHCALMRFRCSDWNRFAVRRDIIFNFLALKDSEENMNTVRITPEGATFVEVREKCEDNLKDINLEYTPTWKNLDNYSDLHHMIMSTYPAAIDMRVKEPNLLFFVRNLLREIRPLSYS